MYRKVLLILFSVMLIFSFGLNINTAISYADSSQQIGRPYKFPVYPGTDEWKSLNDHPEKIEVCQVPQNYIDIMTTDALIKTVIDYPLLGEMFAWDSTEYGYNIVKGYCNCLSALVERDDAPEKILYAYENPEDFFDFDNVYNQMSYLCLPYICDDICGTSFSVYAAAGFPDVTNSNVVTPNGTQVPHKENTTYAYWGTTAAKAASNQAYWSGIYPNATKVSNPNPKYNCHSYAWHSTASTNKYWLSSPNYYYSASDHSYVSTTSAPVKGRKLVYKGYGSIEHSAIVWNTTSSIKVRSKWGYMGVFYHKIADCPYYHTNGNTVLTYYKRS